MKDKYRDIVYRIVGAIDYLGIDNSYLEGNNPIIYHYTKLEHAKKILRGKKLMFTKGSKLVENDKDELPLSCITMTPNRTHLIKHVLKKRDVPINHLANTINLINSDTDFFEENLKEVVSEHRSRIGIACFNETPDNDYLWEHYASKGAGVCIGFKASAFDSAGAVVSKVKYDDTTYTVDYGDYGIEALVVWTLIKKIGFTKENEIRAICFDPARRCDSKGRARFNHKDIIEIHTGPNMSELERIQLKNILKQEGYVDSVRLINK